MKYGAASGRRSVILDRLHVNGFAATAALARDMAVSEMTVRRDLVTLHEEGAVTLVRGGAALPMAARSTSFGTRQLVNAAAKRLIAQRAAQFLGGSGTVALDAGTTTYALAEALPSDFAGCVVTSSLPVVQLLLDRGAARVIGLGGELHRASRAFVGPLAVEGARRLRVGTFFLGAAAVDRHGIYVEADLERPTKLALMEIAEQVVLLADDSKFDRSALVLLCPLSTVSRLVTNAPPPAKLAGALRRAGVELELAAPELP